MVVCLALSALNVPLVGPQQTFAHSVVVGLALSALDFPLMVFPPVACLPFHTPIITV